MLKQIRRQKGLTQEKLAEISGVDQAIISRMEAGKIGQPSYEKVVRLAKALRVKPEKIFQAITAA